MAINAATKGDLGIILDYNESGNDYDQTKVVVTKVLNKNENLYECLVVSDSPKHQKGDTIHHKANEDNWRLFPI